MDEDRPWLPDEAQQLWRRWLHLNALLTGVLHRGLQADAGLSLPDYHVLVQLTDSREGRVRVSALACGLNWERSRASHHVTRMERRGLVRREECRDDGRGAWVVLAAEGRAAIEQAAPAHVATVRRLVFDAVTPAEAQVLAGVVDRVLTRLEAEAAQVEGGVAGPLAPPG